MLRVTKVAPNTPAAGKLQAGDVLLAVDGALLAVVTDVITRLFSNDIAPLRTARSIGLGAVNRIAPLRRNFMQHAMGTVGDLPRLVRGEAL